MIKIYVRHLISISISHIHWLVYDFISSKFQVPLRQGHYIKKRDEERSCETSQIYILHSSYFLVYWHADRYLYQAIPWMTMNKTCLIFKPSIIKHSYHLATLQRHRNFGILGKFMNLVFVLGSLEKLSSFVEFRSRFYFSKIFTL